jgi:hypothetical protein
MVNIGRWPPDDKTGPLHTKSLDVKYGMSVKVDMLIQKVLLPISLFSSGCLIYLLFRTLRRSRLSIDIRYPAS